jgi:homocysteine S-methyltransferase
LSKSAFEQILAANRPIVIDGGLATQLEAQGCDINNPLWSASIITQDPQAIVDAHRAYLDAGAEIIISASYQAIDPELIAGAVNLAVQARDEFVRDNPDTITPLVAGSIGPYGAVLSDGSEYTGDYGVSSAELFDFHRSRIAQLDTGAADILACETIPSYDEAIALRDLLADASSPAWISFSCRDGACINDGTTIETAVELFRDHPSVRAIGVNCSGPQHIASLIRRIRVALPEMPILVYPNSGELFNANDKTWSGTTTASDWVPAAQEWLAAGATLVGGCCRTGPEHIQAIRQTIHRILE